MSAGRLTATVRRESFADRWTLGSLYLGDLFECFTLEDRVREDPDPSTPANEAKVYGETAIPAGRYRMVLTRSPRLGIVTPELLEVPGFLGIRIHVANRPEEVLGCIAVGMGRSAGFVSQSHLAFNALMQKLTPRHAAGHELWCNVQ